MNLKEAKQLKKGDVLIVNDKVMQRGNRREARLKITSVKTWKTRPAQILIGTKYGLYEFGKLNENDLKEVRKE